MPSNEIPTGELVRLSQIEYDADPGQPDLMGWPVVDADGTEFGVLEDMLVDTETGEIPFATICAGDKCTAVPLELFFLDEPARRLVLPVDQEEVMKSPDFTDDTEDIQPHIDYWGQIAANWEADDMEEESEDASGNNKTL